MTQWHCSRAHRRLIKWWCSVVTAYSEVTLWYHTVTPIIFEGQFQVVQRFSSSKLVLKAVETCFVALNYYGDGSSIYFVESSLLLRLRLRLIVSTLSSHRFYCFEQKHILYLWVKCFRDTTHFSSQFVSWDICILESDTTVSLHAKVCAYVCIYVHSINLCTWGQNPCMWFIHEYYL
jgi:hypothetical protein